MKFAKFLRTLFIIEHHWWLLRTVTQISNTKKMYFVLNYGNNNRISSTAQPVFACSKLTIETLEQGVKYA